MEDLTVEKVNKWLFWLMITFFMGVTYLNFRVLFHTIAQMLWRLPFWLLLMFVVVITLFIIYLIDQGDRKLNELEATLSEHQIQMIEIKRKIRLVKQDLKQISPIAFKYYSADFLRTLHYQEVKMLLDKEMIDIEAQHQDGTIVYVKCVLATGELFRHQLHQLHYKMLQDGIKTGMVLANHELDEEEERWASTFNIECLNGEKLIGMIENLLEYRS